MNKKNTLSSCIVGGGRKESFRSLTWSPDNEAEKIGMDRILREILLCRLGVNIRKRNK